MANEKEIGDIVKKCKILLLDIEGTTTSISFVKDKLFPYAEQNVKQFLDSQWENADVKDAVAELRKLSLEDKESSVEGVVVIPGEDASKEDQIEGLVNNVKWQMSADRKAGPLKQLQGLIWKQGYDSGDIKGHVYDDVSAALEAWHSADDQKVYIYSSGSVQAQKMLFGQSKAGDLLKYIDGHFDTAVGAKQEAASYTNIVEKIGCKADEILFLTDILKEAEAARAAGLSAALVARDGNAPLPAGAAFPVLHSLAQLTVSNKRKPEPQEETPAAKILKTDSNSEVKATTDTAEAVEPAKMEVEEKVTSTENIKPSLPVKEHVIVEELDSNEATSITSVADLEPVTVELPEEIEKKTEQRKTEVEKETAEDAKKEKGDAPVQEETPPTVMEVEEITDDKIESADIIEDVVPIIEEPEMGEDMEELKNVGDVLEKECDEILSKVNDVTNLDNITVKPLLNPITEETMETDNTDSNDIVERILDTEIDLEMKQCSDIDPNTVTEMSDETKTEVMEDNGEKENSSTEKEEVETEKNEIIAEKVKMVTEQKEIIAEKVKMGTEQKEMVTKNNAATDADSPKVTNPDKESEQDVKVDDVHNKELPVDVTSAEVKVAPEPKEKEAVDVKNAEALETEVKPTEVKAVDVKTVKETKPVEAPVKEDKPTEQAPQESKVEPEEPQLNGNNKSANGDAKEVGLNGDATKEEELNSRLSDAVENGKVNGSNGDSIEGEKGQGDCKVEAESSEIKVKSVVIDEPRTDPIEQPTEA